MIIEVQDENKVHKFTVPGSWNECDKGMAIKIMNLLSDSRADGAKRLDMFFLLSGATKLEQEMLLNISPFDLHQITYHKCFDWVWHGGIIEYLFKSFWLRGRKWTGPRNLLTNIKLVEMRTALQSFSRYSKTQKEVDLNRLIACVWHPRNRLDFIARLFPRYKNDPRMLLSSYRFKKWNAQVAKMDYSLKFSLFLQFAGVWRVFEKKFKFLFPENAGQTSGENPRAWDSIIAEMATKGLFGNLLETEMYSATKVFIYMDGEIKKSQDLKLLTKKQSNGIN